jgi:hypothetical protein
MDNRSKFLYFMTIDKRSVPIVFLASVPAREHVERKGRAESRSGATEWEDQSVRIDCTLNA